MPARTETAGAVWDPVIVGGVGGSGTRLIARIVQLAGYDIGSDLNDALDNLSHVLLFTRPDVLDVSDDTFRALARIFTATLRGGTVEAGDDALAAAAVAACVVLDEPWRAERLQRLRERLAHPAAVAGRCGWKVPDTHIMLDRWRTLVPGLRYVHVLRHGLDMAYSRQRQSARWAHLFFEPGAFEFTPRWVLKYWCAVQRRAEQRAREMGDRFLMLNYDALCSDPQAELPKLLRFIGCDPAAGQHEAMVAAVAPPASIGRFRAHDRTQFDAADLEYVESLGFAVR